MSLSFGSLYFVQNLAAVRLRNSQSMNTVLILCLCHVQFRLRPFSVDVNRVTKKSEINTVPIKSTVIDVVLTTTVRNGTTNCDGETTIGTCS